MAGVGTLVLVYFVTTGQPLLRLIIFGGAAIMIGLPALLLAGVIYGVIYFVYQRPDAVTHASNTHPAVDEHGIIDAEWTEVRPGE